MKKIEKGPRNIVMDFPIERADALALSLQIISKHEAISNVRVVMAPGIEMLSCYHARIIKEFYENKKLADKWLKVTIKELTTMTTLLSPQRLSDCKEYAKKIYEVMVDDDEIARSEHMSRAERLRGYFKFRAAVKSGLKQKKEKNNERR